MAIVIHYCRDGRRWCAGPFQTARFVQKWIKWALVGATNIKLEML